MQGCVIRRRRPSYRLALSPAFAAYRANEMMRTFWNLARKVFNRASEMGDQEKKEVSARVRRVLQMSAHRSGQMSRIMKAFGSWQLFVSTVEERQALASTLAYWEKYIQVASGTYDPNSSKPLLRVENYVDEEAPPAGFVYIKDFLPGPGVVFPDDPKMGCSCANCYQDRKGCCPAFNDLRFAYTANGTLSAPFGSPIFECNRLCSCDMSCPNRVVQRGCKVITDEEAERRGRWYDEQGTTYLFDLDYHLTDESQDLGPHRRDDSMNQGRHHTEEQDEGTPLADESMDQGTLYTVDAGTYGNIAHFVNHSCEPNMAVCMVWINNLDLRMPRLAFFTNRDICTHEELTVDYKMSPGAATPDSKRPHSKIRIPCKCGSKKCRKFLN
ncbi:hypothetical protein HPB51_022141 [Rhipicephalus microplus]|uniref:Histone-lysine n-methyltransferase n=1 Tax=Rhipicephalus microplus TaxID=6941 RepID=A0A9J6ECM1_RHIMP|nr:hypothetical protein HPB51_022141 [Rhipicephalus microplus]